MSHQGNLTGPRPVRWQREGREQCWGHGGRAASCRFLTANCAPLAPAPNPCDGSQLTPGTYTILPQERCLWRNFPQGSTSQSSFGFLKSVAALRYPLFPARATIRGWAEYSGAQPGKGRAHSHLSWVRAGIYMTHLLKPAGRTQSRLREGVLAWAPAVGGSGFPSTTGGSD